MKDRGNPPQPGDPSSRGRRIFCMFGNQQFGKRKAYVPFVFVEISGTSCFINFGEGGHRKMMNNG